MQIADIKADSKAVIDGGESITLMNGLPNAVAGYGSSSELM